MKILHKCIAGYLGYYGSLEALQSCYPEGGEAGSFFLNGETSTLWMWNPVTACWCDTNYASAPDLVGMITDPETFSPSIIANKEALYYYVATTAGSYGFPKLPGTMIKIEVSCSQSSIILLHWDGSKWDSTTGNTTGSISSDLLQQSHPIQHKYGKLSTASLSLPQDCK